MEFRTRSKGEVLEDLVEKLRMVPAGHPDGVRLSRMVNDLRVELGHLAMPHLSQTSSRQNPLPKRQNTTQQ
jgi:hypothetical protein